jgi:hypothetical protein
MHAGAEVVECRIAYLMGVGTECWLTLSGALDAV